MILLWLRNNSLPIGAVLAGAWLCLIHPLLALFGFGLIVAGLAPGLAWALERAGGVLDRVL